MLRKMSAIATLAIVVGASGPALAQGGLDDRFDIAPAVGEPLPDLTLYNADGGEVRLRDAVRGHHSVMVFGCLT